MKFQRSNALMQFLLAYTRLLQFNYYKIANFLCLFEFLNVALQNAPNFRDILYFRKAIQIVMRIATSLCKYET